MCHITVASLLIASCDYDHEALVQMLGSGTLLDTSPRTSSPSWSRMPPALDTVTVSAWLCWVLWVHQGDHQPGKLLNARAAPEARLALDTPDLQCPRSLFNAQQTQDAGTAAVTSLRRGKEAQ